MICCANIHPNELKAFYCITTRFSSFVLIPNRRNCFTCFNCQMSLRWDLWLSITRMTALKGIKEIMFIVNLQTFLTQTIRAQFVSQAHKLILKRCFLLLPFYSKREASSLMYIKEMTLINHITQKYGHIVASTNHRKEKCFITYKISHFL